jgi:hypothetical protein
MDWPAVKKAMAGLFASNSFRKSAKIAALCSCIFLTYFIYKNLKEQSFTASSNPDSTEASNKIGSWLSKVTVSIRSALAATGAFMNDRWGALREKFQKPPEATGVSMPFDSTGDNEGWGVCTLRSKRRLGRTSFVQYEFDLPSPDYVLPLDLGQQISLCCLDNANKVAKGEFFPYNSEAKKRLGSFSILAPNRTPPENEFAIGDDAANFVSAHLNCSMFVWFPWHIS